VRATSWFAAGVLSLIAASVVAARLREADGATGLLATLLVGLIYAGVWLVVSSHLPRRPGPLRELVPGAVLFAVGMEAIHLFTAYYLVDRAERAQSTYGAIGAALVALLWLYVVSRLIVGSAVVNAELARHAQARREAAGEREWTPDG
jgi:uncharacterized BrkB/YihY/UPF0761 family membrane protein